MRGTILLGSRFFFDGECSVPAQESASTLTSRTIENESLQRGASEHFSFVSQENPTRTGGRLWIEKSVQIEGGILRRLISVDGVPLSPGKARIEDRRIANLVAYPDEFRPRIRR
jgi:hypothetical protein